MGGHGGLNILPQKRWNVYNFDNREKVRQDEEAAAREEQLQREKARRQEAEFRLERLRATRGLAPLKPAPEAESETAPEEVGKVAESEPKTAHINLFEGIRIFDPVESKGKQDDKDRDGPKKKKMKKEESPRVITPEDEKYRLGYGVAGKGVKVPWYLEKKDNDVKDERSGVSDLSRSVKEGGKKSGKKTLEELREERIKREKREKEREMALVSEIGRKRGSYSREKERELALLSDRVGKRGPYSQDSRYSRR